MGADIYLRSEYEKREKEFDLDQKRAVLDQARQDGHDSDAAKKAYADFEEALTKTEEGTYYRDSYNSSNLAWLVGLSYWNEGANLNSDGNLPVDRMAHWLNVLQQANIKAVVIDAVENGKANAGRKPLDHERVKPELELEPSEKIEDVIQYFEQKRQRFMALLSKGIDLQEPLEWSV